MRTKDENKIGLIFEASLQLIVKEGIAGLTMSKLAKEAKIAIGTLYIYFKSKEELLHKLYLKLKNESMERFMQEYDETKPFNEGFRQVWFNYFTHRVHHYKESVFMEQYYRSPYITTEDKNLAESMKHPIHQLMQRGKRELLVKNNVDDEMLFLSLLGFIRELADEHVAGVYTLTDEKIEMAQQLSWENIKR